MKILVQFIDLYVSSITLDTKIHNLYLQHKTRMGYKTKNNQELVEIKQIQILKVY